MPKRFTDSEKWKSKFIRSLDTPYKLLWLYICDDCDYAGIWRVEIDIAAIRTGEELDPDRAKEQLKKHIIEIDGGEKWFIPSFLIFQYGELNPDNRVHRSVIDRLKKYKLFEKYKGLIRSLQGAKEKDKDKEKEEEILKRAKLLLEYLNKKANKNFQMIASNYDHIRARLRDNYTDEECRRVIDNKISQWTGDEKSEAWICPATIFRKNKFDGYVNEKPAGGGGATSY